MRFYNLLVLLISIYSVNAFAAPSPSLSLKTYLSNYFSNNEIKKNIDLDKEIQISESKTLSNNLDGLLSITPSRSQQKDKNIQPSWDRKDQVSATYTQNLPTGTRVSVGGTKHLNNSLRFDEQVDNSFFIRLEQDLWRNGFGHNQRSNKKIAKANILSAKLNHSIQTASQCNQAVTLYMNAYRDLKAYQIYKELNTSSKKSFATTKKSYRQRLTQKIDYIAAQADQLSNEQRLIAADARLQTSLNELFNSIALPVNKDIKLEKPNLKLATSKTTVLAADYTQLYDADVKAKKLNYSSQKNTGSPELKLYLEGSKNNNQFTDSLSREDTENVNVGLNINIPINDTGLKSRSKTSYYNWKKAENEKSYQLRKLKNDLANSNKQNEKFAQQLAVLEKQKSNYKQLTIEAKRLLRSGRIEYNTYIQYRDQEFNNEFTQIDTYRDLLLGQIEVSLLTTPQTNLCSQLASKKLTGGELTK